MSIKVTWHGHATWLISIGQKNILLDPFYTDNPAAPVTKDEIKADVVLISHGHFDHVADAAEITNRENATLVAIYEIASWFSKEHGVNSSIGMNIGGQTKLDYATIKMVPAIHSSQLPDGSYGGMPAGYVVMAEGKKIYFACDTALFSDMQLIGKLGIDLAVLPIGDLFTMGIDDCIEAIKLIAPHQVLPTHYNTWPPIEQDVASWSQRVSLETQAVPVVLKPGESHEL